MYLAMNGPKVSTPHRPITTLGMPASSSRKPPITLASRRGSRSTTTSAAPIDTGTAMISAISVVSSVPTICGTAPYCWPEMYVMPCDVTDLPYWLPVFQTLLVKKSKPLIWIAGHALTNKITRMKASISVGIQAPPKPSQRIKLPLRHQRWKAEPPGRGGGWAAPPSGAAGRAAMAS